MFIVGIDIAKRSHEAIIIAEDGQVVRKAFSFRNNCTGYNLLLEQVRRLTLVKSQIVFAMESTAHYWLALYARLLKDGYTVMVLNPIQSHSLRELYIRKAKTDARDSVIIADLVRFGRCKASNVPQDKILALRELCRSRAYLVDMAADLKRKLIALFFQEFNNSLTSIPGVGTVLAATILSEIGDITRFSSADKLLAYVGLDPSVKQSGEFKSNQNRISKRGSPYLRRAIWLASTVAVHRDPMFQTYYEKKISEGLHYMNVIGHVSRKMTAVIFAVLRDGQPYQPVLQTAD